MDKKQAPMLDFTKINSAVTILQVERLLEEKIGEYKLLLSKLEKRVKRLEGLLEAQKEKPAKQAPKEAEAKQAKKEDAK